MKSGELFALLGGEASEGVPERIRHRRTQCEAPMTRTTRLRSRVRGNAHAWHQKPRLRLKVVHVEVFNRDELQVR